MQNQALATQPSSWANLPSELLSLIISKHTTDTAADYVFYRSICRGWRRSLTDYSPIHPLPSPQLPFLLLPSHNILPIPQLGNVFPLPFLNPFQAPRFYSDLPQLQNSEGCICVGSSHGWLITLGRDSSVFLLNPVTADSLHLSPLSSIDNANINFNPDSFPQYQVMPENKFHTQSSIIRRAVLSSDPAEDCNFTLLLFLSDMVDCCFTWSGRGGPWTKHVHRPFSVEDVVSMINGVFVAINRRNNLVFFDFRNHDTGLVLGWNNILLKPPTGDIFLVKSDSRLLIVFTCCFLQPSQYFIPRGYIQLVLEFPKDEAANRAMQEVRELRDHVLFLGHGCSVSVSIRHFPGLIKDATYFTHVYCKMERVERGGWRKFPLYQGAVYQNIITARPTSESIKVCDVENSQDAGLWNYRRPFWVTPNINRIRR